MKPQTAYITNRAQPPSGARHRREPKVKSTKTGADVLRTVPADMDSNKRSHELAKKFSKHDPRVSLWGNINAESS